MKIFYAASRYDYGHPARGLSFEHANFYDSLARMGHELLHFDFQTLLNELGRDRMNQRLQAEVERQRPDLLFVCLTGDELDFATLKSLSDSGATTTFNWFCDDHWRFEKFSRRWAPAFNWVATTAACALPKYQQIGYKNVIKTQWACNHFQYRRLDLPLQHDVSFVGRVFGKRPQIIQTLRRAGINVCVRGFGWPEGRVTQEEMVRVFNQSRINLNFSDAAKQLNWFKRLTGRKPPPKQIKGRNFEIPGCGGFLLTDSAENLEEYFELGKEVVVFDSTDDLVDKARYYLNHESERCQIAEAGYHRALREHTYELRFNQLFKVMGLT
jgi:spore maturation protein CgeB